MHLESATLTVAVPVTVRLARYDDLPKLEWFGQYRRFRALYARSFREQEAGRRLMLLADVGGFPVGHIFVSLRLGETFNPPYAYFYSFRVLEMLRGLGIGSFLLAYAESAAQNAGCSRALIAVAKTNSRAQRLYERHGYRVFAEDPGRWEYRDHEGVIHQEHEPCWLLEKHLVAR